MDKNTLHQFIDDCWDGWQERREPVERPMADTLEPEEAEVAPAPVKVHPPDTRVVRTKATGDKVYLLNDKELTKRWITSPQVLEGLGFDLSEVTEIPDMDLTKYKPVSAAFNAQG